MTYRAYTPPKQLPCDPIRSVLKAARILQHVAEAPDGALTSQLVLCTGIPTYTLYHLLRSLVYSGLLAKYDRFGPYFLGPTVPDLFHRQLPTCNELPEPVQRVRHANLRHIQHLLDCHLNNHEV